MSDPDLFASVQRHLGNGHYTAVGDDTVSSLDGTLVTRPSQAAAPLQPTNTQVRDSPPSWHENVHASRAGHGSLTVSDIVPQDEYPYATKLDSPPGSMHEFSLHGGSSSGGHVGPYAQHGWNTSGSDLPLTGNKSGMLFAEDEDDQARQLGHPPPLYSNYVLAVDDEAGKQAHRKRRAPWNDRALLAQQIEERQRGIGRQRWPVVSWVLAVGFVAVFIVQLALAKQATGEAVQVHPQVQPMIGPPTEFLISWGARFVPCMRPLPALSTAEQLPCLPDSTSHGDRYTQNQLCSIADLCGLKDPRNPNQSYRFVTAIALFVRGGGAPRHADLADILFNLTVLLTLCCQIEKLIGSPAYVVVFLLGGIGGNLLGGNFGLIGQPALGASGSIYTCISLEIVDLIYNWSYEMRIKTRVAMSIIFAILGLALGLLPGLDNFSHIGGFCLGVLGGMMFAPSIHATRTHFLVCWAIRILGFGLMVAFFVSLALNFYRSSDPANACHWCRYVLDCVLPLLTLQLPVMSPCVLCV